MDQEYKKEQELEKNQEYKKCMAGEIYDCHDAVFLEFKARTRRLLAEYHMLKYEEKEKKGKY